MQDNPKLVVVTRADLSPAQQAVQAAHAAIDFCFQHPGRASPWHAQSNYLVLLALKNEQELLTLISRCQDVLLDHTVFREPDLGNPVTAVAIEPSAATQKLVRRIPLLLKTHNHESI